ncbi:hypothetical protein TWF788_007677 [Orbilia oligospora]|uniref:Uncharacterized protein n=1 Tax=Orbilia oligospora TaxID=2813651 RepID=A0A7C8U248_ORBOL|nr:hypothetical protein TWF788_007677 [Orbilia oligospora]
MAPSKSFILYFIALFFALLPSEGHLVGTKSPGGRGFPGAQDILEGRNGELGSYGQPSTPINLSSWPRRAKWKRNDEDTDMEDLGYDDDVNSGESVPPVKQLIIERFNKGNLVEMQFAEKRAAIPAQDPGFDLRTLEKAFPSQKHIRGVPASVADITHRMIPELRVDRFSFENRRTYGLTKRVEVDAGGITEAIVFMLWNDLSSKWRSDPEGTASTVLRRLKIRVTTGDAYPHYVSGDTKWMLPLQA